MRNKRVVPLAAAALLAAGVLNASVRELELGPVSAAVVVDGWPPVSSTAARRLIAQYGPPDEVHPNWLVWNDRRPWKRTIVRIMTPLDTREGDRGIVEQMIEYPLTSRQASELKSFDPRLSYDRKSRELHSRSEREEVNFLRLNLANDIVNRRMTADQARSLFAQILRLEAAGKSSSYLQVLYFPR